MCKSKKFGGGWVGVIEHLLESGWSGLVSGLPVCRTKGDTNLKMIWFSPSLCSLDFESYNPKSQRSFCSVLVLDPIITFHHEYMWCLVAPTVFFLPNYSPNLASFPFSFFSKQIIKSEGVLFSYTKFASLSQRFALVGTIVALMIVEYLIFMILYSYSLFLFLSFCLLSTKSISSYYLLYSLILPSSRVSTFFSFCNLNYHPSSYCIWVSLICHNFF